MKTINEQKEILAKQKGFVSYKHFCNWTVNYGTYSDQVAFDKAAEEIYKNQLSSNEQQPKFVKKISTEALFVKVSEKIVDAIIEGWNDWSRKFSSRAEAEKYWQKSIEYQLHEPINDTVFNNEALGAIIKNEGNVIFNGVSKNTTIENAECVIFNGGAENTVIENAKQVNDNKITMLNPNETLTEDKLIELFGANNKNKIDEFMQWYKYVVKFNTK